MPGYKGMYTFWGSAGVVPRYESINIEFGQSKKILVPGFTSSHVIIKELMTS